jgi:hypothetical protein
MSLMEFENRASSEYATFVSKSDLIREAEKYCNTSFLIPQSGSMYTAWASMKLLETKGLVDKTGHPAKYCLSDDGKVLGEKLWSHHYKNNDDISSTQKSEIFSLTSSQSRCDDNFSNYPESSQNNIQRFNNDSDDDLVILGTSNENDMRFSSSQNIPILSQVGGIKELVPRIVRAGSYEIKLIVDNRERPNRSSSHVADFREGLLALGIEVDFKPLEVGT